MSENQEESIQSQGGKARAKALDEGERKSIAKKAAKARWGIQAIRRGNFKEEFGIEVECYVLDDENKTAVISQTGMGEALGMSGSGKAFPRFLRSNSMKGAIGAELAEKILQPVKFQWRDARGGPVTVFGFDATILIDVCRAIIEVEDKLLSNQKHIARQAHIILNASAKAGIKGLVYALAGYVPAAEEVIAAFKMYVQEEARKYEREFPNELYQEWHRLYEIPILPRGKPWHFKHLTVKHVYYPLAKSNGKLLELLRALKLKEGDRQKKLFQFLNEIGARAMRMQMGRVLEMAESSPDRLAYELKIAERFGGQPELKLVLPTPDEQ